MKEATGGRGADVVVDDVGEATWQRTLQAAAARRPGRRLRRDDRPEPAGGAAPHLVEAALDPRLDDGHEGRLRGAPTSSSRSGRARPVVDSRVPARGGPRGARAARVRRAARQGRPDDVREDTSDPARPVDINGDRRSTEHVDPFPQENEAQVDPRHRDRRGDRSHYRPGPDHARRRQRAPARPESSIRPDDRGARGLVFTQIAQPVLRVSTGRGSPPATTPDRSSPVDGRPGRRSLVPAPASSPTGVADRSEPVCVSTP